MARRNWSAPKPFLALVVSLVLLAAFLLRGLWLPALGWALIHDDGPAKADFAVVLGGDYNGLRIEQAAGLVRAGYVPMVLVSGPSFLYGAYERELAIAFIVRQGYPPQWFAAIPGRALNTRDEAYEVLAELRRRDAHSFLLITSDYHSGRASRTFRGVAREIGYTPTMRTVAAPDKYFRASDWWRNREARKVVFLEWTKTAASAIGL